MISVRSFNVDKYCQLLSIYFYNLNDYFMIYFHFDTVVTLNPFIWLMNDVISTAHDCKSTSVFCNKIIFKWPYNEINRVSWAQIFSWRSMIWFRKNTLDHMIWNIFFCFVQKCSYLVSLFVILFVPLWVFSKITITKLYVKTTLGNYTVDSNIGLPRGDSNLIRKVFSAVLFSLRYSIELPLLYRLCGPKYLTLRFSRKANIHSNDRK